MKTLFLTTAAVAAFAGTALAQTGVQIGAPVSSATVLAPQSAAPAASVTTSAEAGAAATASPAAAAPSTAVTATVSAAPAPISDDELRKVAIIASEATKLRTDAQSKITAAATAEAKAAAQAELSTSMQGAVTTKGMTVERYNEIAKAVAADPALATRLGAAASAGAASSPASSTTTAQ